MITIANILNKPRITEKATDLAGRTASGSVVTFEVSQAVNKKQVTEAVTHYYKVTPVKVNIVNLPAKKITSRGRKGTKSAIKKALVYLKPGDSIEFI